MKSTRDPWKGSTAVLILATLADKPGHGYAIAREIERKSNHLITLGEGSLYPALMVMEQEGLVTSEWQTPPAGGGAARKVYTITEAGSTELSRRAKEVRALAEAITDLLIGVPNVAPSPA